MKHILEFSAEKLDETEGHAWFPSQELFNVYAQINSARSCDTIFVRNNVIRSQATVKYGFVLDFVTSVC